jgi:hypothetical protein
MLIELQKGVVLQPGTFNAVLAPEEVIISAINNNPDIQRYLFLFVGGNYSRILSGIHRTATNFEVRRAFTAHQLFTILKEASHTVVFIEHDSSMYDGAWEMITPISGALREIGRESMVILFSVTPDRAFGALIQKADRVYSLSSVDTSRQRHVSRSSRSQTQHWQHHSPQKTLDIFSGKEIPNPSLTAKTHLGEKGVSGPLHPLLRGVDK